MIPAGGSGVRFRELGKMYPKCTLPHEGRAIISHIVDRAYVSSAKAIYVAVLNHEQEIQVKMALADMYDERLKIVLLDDSNFVSGPATTLRLAFETIGLGDEPVFVMLSDGFSENYSFYKDFASLGLSGFNLIATTKLQRGEDRSRWCMLDVEEGSRRVSSFVDKPRGPCALSEAASGYYFLQSAREYCLAYDEVCRSPFSDTEPQFSRVFEQMISKGHVFKTPELRPEKNLDFGTLEAYIQNRGIYKSRSFNHIELTDLGTVIKHSADRPNKIAMEAAWHEKSPLRLYSPRLIGMSFGSTGTSIEMDRCNGILLRELYLYLDRSVTTWKRVFGQTSRFFGRCVQSKYTREYPSEFWLDYESKNKQRLDKLTNVVDFPAFNQKRLLEGLLIEHHGRLRESDWYYQTSLFHGDLHLGNMFYDMTSDRLQLIDPRGEIYGHWAYDLSKMLHSLYGRYDFIDAQFYRCLPNSCEASYYDKNVSEVLEVFMDTEPYASLSQDERKLILEMTAFLFLTMIPLHTDNQLNQRLMYNEFWRLLELSNAH